MPRVLIAFLLIIILGPDSFGQVFHSNPMLKNGRLKTENSLLGRKISHTGWQSSRFGDNYYVLIQMDRPTDSPGKEKLAAQGIRLEQWISGNSWLAVCNSGFILKNPAASGIKNIYAIPPALKIDQRLKENLIRATSLHDLIAVTCFPVEKAAAEKFIKESGAEIVETKIKPANTWFIRASVNSIDKISLLPFISSISPIHLEDVPLNYNNRAVHGVQSLSATVGRNLSGKNLIIGIGDNANPSGHIDLAGKLILRTDEPVDNHGTHTSGTISGGGISNPLYAGMAPRSRLVVNDFSNIIVNSPTYVGDFNMPLTNNSYYNGGVGCTGDGDYNVLSNYVDDQMLAYPQLLHVFAAGNDGWLYLLAFSKIFFHHQIGVSIG